MTTGEFGPVRLTEDGPLTVLTLAGNDLNLFDLAMMDGIKAATSALAADPPRGLLVQAQGRMVSGGVDVHDFSGVTPAQGAHMWRELFPVMHRIEELPCPTVFAAHGLCLTAAFEMALACDLLVAAEGAKFGLVEVVVGLTPSMGGPQRLAERAGPARAKELILTGELFSAETLERWNVVNRVLPKEGFAEAAHAFALRLANGPTRAHNATKQIVATAVRHGSRAADVVTPELSGALFGTDDLKGAVASFLADGPGRATYTGQ